MSTSVEMETVKTSGHLMLGTVPTPLAIATGAVQRILRLADWSGEAPPELSELVDVRFATQLPAWVLLLGNATDSDPILVRGRIGIAQFHRDSLVAMPARATVGFDLFTHVVAASATPSALVLNIIALRRVLGKAGI